MVTKKKKQTRLPAKWWRDPLPRGKRDEYEFQTAVAKVRAERIKYLQDAIRELRSVANGYEARDGFPLDSKALVRIPKARYDKIRRDILKVRDAKSRPYIEVKPRSARQTKSTISKTGQLLKGQRVYFFHDWTGDNVQASFVDGNLQITQKIKDATLTTRYYFFPKKPRSWDDIVNYTKQLQRTGMRDGFYKMYNSIYGEIGESNSLDQLQNVLNEVYYTYGKWLAGTILGWSWTGDNYKSDERRTRVQQSIRQRYRERQAILKAEREDKILVRLGKKKSSKKKVAKKK